MQSLRSTSRSSIKVALALAAGVAALALSAPVQAAQCIKAGGWGTGALESFASFMAEAAMKNSAKARLGDGAKIGAVSTRCQLKGVLFECNSSARACK